MAWSRVLVAIVTVASLSSTSFGCSLAREALGAERDASGIDGGGRDGGGGVDGGHVDAGMRDADVDGGGGCTASSCDDRQPCTDDACDSSGVCTHTPNAAACDDGVFCNGADTCSGGTCATHAGDPCTGGTTCDPSSDACVGCRTTADCPMPITGPWTECAFADTCTTTGSHTRTTQTFTCSAGACVAAMADETEACTRPSTDGTMCAAPVYGPFGACDFGADPCAQAGTQFRTVTLSACAAGACVPTTTDEPMACMRSTDGAACGTATTGPWSTCMVGVACGTTGTQTRTSTAPTCMAGTCNPHLSTETQACMVSSVDGSPCGTPTCSDWGPCVQTTPNSCDARGTQTRSCSTPVCGGGTCGGSVPSTETQACTVDVNGQRCTETMCGACRARGSFGCPSGSAGQRSCSTSDGNCTNIGFGFGCFDLTPSFTTQPCTCP